MAWMRSKPWLDRLLRGATHSRTASVTVAVLVAALVLRAAGAAAQCALCGQGTRYAGSSPERAVAALLAGTIVLLLPPVTLAVCLGRFLWKHRQP